MIDLYQGDCLEVMPKIDAGIVDLVLTDPPYGTTACKWDSVIPFEPMWENIWRVTKPNAAIALFGCEPFSSALRMSQINRFKYDWIWRKTTSTGFLNAKKMPLKNHEIISLFYKKQPTYNPQKTTGHKRKVSNRISRHEIYGDANKKVLYDSTERYPLSIQQFKSDRYKAIHHSSQKPVALLEYLIKTYTNEGDTVLDFTMGSGSTGVACKNLNRNFIGIEKDKTYFDIAKERNS